MREIKFRAWHKGKMFTVESLTWNPTNLSAEFNNGSVLFSEENYYPPNADYSYELMQYTGLKDRNGMEIWEGDILRYGASKSSGTIMDVYIPNKLVEWNEEQSGFGLLKETVADMYEVIGNIYENPDLLDK